jgi:glutamyl/glutaminyl-tRNA synthetase
VIQERIDSVEQFATEFSYFFEPVQLEEEAVHKLALCLEEDAVRIALTALLERMSCVKNTNDAELLVKEVAKKHGVRVGRLFLPLRLALSGRNKGVSVPLLLSTLGAEESATRLAKVLRSS